jgi:Glycosyltransferase family 87
MVRPRLRRYAIALLLGIAVGFVVFLASSNGLSTPGGARVGGDFPAFYSAARMVRSGNIRELYDPRVQEEAQRDLFPAGVRGRLPFAYPPFVALAYVPFTWLPFKAAYATVALLMAMCVVVAVRILCRILPHLQGWSLPTIAAVIAFYPIFRAILGGQNTPLSLLCAAGAASGMARNRDMVAGLWTGVWFFKPQLALPVAVVLFVRATDKARFLAGVALVCGVYYLIGSALAGPAWPMWWLHHGAVPFAVEDIVVDRGNAISFPQLGAALGLTPLSWIAAVLAAGLALWLALKKRHPLEVTAVAAAAAVLMAPHALYYDGGLAALGLTAAAALRPSALTAVGAIWLLAFLQPLSSFLPVPPMTIVVMLSMWLVARDSPRFQGTG